MKKSLLSFSLVCLFLVDVSASYARDVQLRSRSETELTPLSGNKSTSNTTRKLTTEERIARLERILDSQGLVDMLVRIENLQSELQILRGELELHTHQLEEIKQRQRDLYVDIDRRLLRLERNAPATGATTPSVPSTATTTSKPSPTTTKPAVTAAPGKSAKKPSGDFASEQKAYQFAFDLLRELRYDEAVSAFQDFIAAYPNGRYAHIAQYWIGEANYAQRKFKLAIVDYQKLIDSYPNSPKLAEAMLKIGYSQYELKNYKKAEAMLKQLTKNYPGTTEAGQAQNLIQKIRLKR